MTMANKVDKGERGKVTSSLPKFSLLTLFLLANASDYIYISFDFEANQMRKQAIQSVSKIKSIRKTEYRQEF
jgi:hypothetical protein